MRCAAAERQAVGPTDQRSAARGIIEPGIFMKKSVETLIESFERLPQDAKLEAAAEILKRSAKLELPPLQEEALLQAADDVFLKLDEEESRRG
jgi:hypothetical protein